MVPDRPARAVRAVRGVGVAVVTRAVSLLVDPLVSDPFMVAGRPVRPWTRPTATLEPTPVDHSTRS